MAEKKKNIKLKFKHKTKKNLVIYKNFGLRGLFCNHLHCNCADF